MMVNSPLTFSISLDDLRRRSFILGAAALALCIAGAFNEPEQFFRSYLLGYLFWVGIPLGCLAILMLHHLVGGAWGTLIQRILEAATRTLPLIALMFLPLVLGLDLLYVWARAEEVAADEVLQQKSLYLNRPFFLLRWGVYFVFWISASHFLSRWSLERDRMASPSLTRRLRFLSAPGLVLYVLTVTFASVDWMMSLEPHWFSTVYGIMWIVGQVLAALAFSIAFVSLLADREPLAAVLHPDQFHDLGNLLLAFVMLWAYIAFSQYLIIWSGNLPEEIPWYLRRSSGGWQWIALFLIVFHFFIPFLLLLSRRTKRHVQTLSAVAAGILLMRLVDMLWLVMPAFHHEGLEVHWMDLAAPLGLGGVWLAFFVWQLQRRPLLPVQGPTLERTEGNG